jgi:hypothetical protein
MANTLHFANLGSNVSVPQLTSSSQVASLNGFGLITTVNTNWHDFDARYFRLGTRLSF